MEIDIEALKLELCDKIKKDYEHDHEMFAKQLLETIHLSNAKIREEQKLEQEKHKTTALDAYLNSSLLIAYKLPMCMDYFLIGIFVALGWSLIRR